MSSICENCGKEFEEEDAREEFESETGKCFEYLTKCLCAECAIEAIDAEEDGVYLEVCDNCGKRFDPFLAEADMQRETGDLGAEINMFGNLCLDCFMDEYQKFCDENKDDDDDDYQGDERLSVDDAALIWISHGKDEEYMFGYSEEELEAAL